MPETLPDPTPAFSQTVRLVQAARTGDRAASNALFERYLPRVQEMVALSLGRSLRQLAGLEDVVQDSMLRAFRAIDSFDSLSEGTFRAFVSRIVTNCVRDTARYYNAQMRTNDVVDHADGDVNQLPDSTSVTTQLRRSELAKTVEDAVLQLNPKQRQVIGLRYVLDLKYSEIVIAMDLSCESSARSLTLRARRDLLRILGTDPFAEDQA